MGSFLPLFSHMFDQLLTFHCVACLCVQSTRIEMENRLISSEEEVKMLRSALETREAEIQLLRQVLFEEQQYQQWAMHNFGNDASSNASSSTVTSPRPHSPMVSSPSNMSLSGSSGTMDTDFASPETSSLGSEVHMMEVMGAHQRRQEKLKQLGGPPSDVYHPWWNGMPVNHPAFAEKEDWQSFELRPQELLAHERLNYFLMMRRYRLEQRGLDETPQQSSAHQNSPGGPSTPMTGASAQQGPPNCSVLQSPSNSLHRTPGNATDTPSYHHHQSPIVSHPYTHQPAAFYQSPHHHSHIMTGAPSQGSGYWSGHFAPATPEKIDFSKISLRKTSSMPQHHQPQHLHQPSATGAPTIHNSSSNPASPNATTSTTTPNHPSPTAAIWRDALAHPEMHRFPPHHLSWLQAQHPDMMTRTQQLQQQQPRVPFRRQMISTVASPNSKP